MNAKFIALVFSLFILVGCTNTSVSTKVATIPATSTVALPRDEIVPTNTSIPSTVTPVPTDTQQPTKVVSTEVMIQSLEDKYGHLVDENNIFFSIENWGNTFADQTTQLSDHTDKNYKSFSFVVWSTGNVYLKEEYDKDLGIKVENIYGEVVFRDISGSIKLLKIRFDVIDPTLRIMFPVCLIEDSDGSSYSDRCGALNFAVVSTVEEELEFYKKVGERLYLTITFARPADEPKVENHWGYFPNTRNRANYFSWLVNQGEYQKLAEYILNNNIGDYDENFVYSAHNVCVYMNKEQYMPYFKK